MGRLLRAAPRSTPSRRGPSSSPSRRRSSGWRASRPPSSTSRWSTASPRPRPSTRSPSRPGPSASSTTRRSSSPTPTASSAASRPSSPRATGWPRCARSTAGSPAREARARTSRSGRRCTPSSGSRAGRSSETTVGQMQIRAYWNSGLIAARRSAGLFAAWERALQRLFDAEIVQKRWPQFMDQLSWAGVTADVHDRVRILSDAYNYPLRHRPALAPAAVGARPRRDRPPALPALVPPARRPARRSTPRSTPAATATAGSPSGCRSSRGRRGGLSLGSIQRQRPAAGSRGRAGSAGMPPERRARGRHRRPLGRHPRGEQVQAVLLGGALDRLVDRLVAR